MEHSFLDGMSSSTPSPQGSGNYMEEEAEESQGPVWPGDTKETRHRRANPHMNLQRPWQHAQGLNRCKADGVSALRQGRKHRLQPPTKKLLTPTDKGKIKIFSQSSVTKYNNHIPRHESAGGTRANRNENRSSQPHIARQASQAQPP